jgi:hypothetical protein
MPRCDVEEEEEEEVVVVLGEVRLSELAVVEWPSHSVRWCGSSPLGAAAGVMIEGTGWRRLCCAACE